MTDEKQNQLWKTLKYVWVLNFAVFVVIALLIGGDAVNGKVEAGHYYLSNHGRLTEVNWAVFIYSYIHVLSIFIMLPFVMIAGIIDLIQKRKEKPK